MGDNWLHFHISTKNDSLIRHVDMCLVIYEGNLHLTASIIQESIVIKHYHDYIATGNAHEGVRG